MAMNKIIEVKNLSASFGEKKILSDISFAAYEKEITVILGGSGAGKSVLLRHLLGLYHGDSGSIHILDRDLETLEEEDLQQAYLQMGVFYQNGGLLNS